MPLPADEKSVAFAEELLKQCDPEPCHAVFGLHPGSRLVHAEHRHPYA